MRNRYRYKTTGEKRPNESWGNYLRRGLELNGFRFSKPYFNMEDLENKKIGYSIRSVLTEDEEVLIAITRGWDFPLTLNISSLPKNIPDKIGEYEHVFVGAPNNEFVDFHFYTNGSAKVDQIEAGEGSSMFAFNYRLNETCDIYPVVFHIMSYAYWSRVIFTPKKSEQDKVNRIGLELRLDQI